MPWITAHQLLEASQQPADVVREREGWGWVTGRRAPCRRVWRGSAPLPCPLCGAPIMHRSAASRRAAMAAERELDLDSEVQQRELLAALQA